MPKFWQLVSEQFWPSRDVVATSLRRPLSQAAVMRMFTALLLVLATSSSLVGLTEMSLPVNESQILYLFSTSAQVISAIYGLTLTGFVFFRNELSREESEDETLATAVEALKKRYFVFLLFVTMLVMSTLLVSNLAISMEGSGESRLTTIAINVGQSLFIVSLAAISYFIFDVISPERIQLASQRIQDELDPSHLLRPAGGLEGFLRNYNYIEMVLVEAAWPKLNYWTDDSERKLQRRPPNSKLAEILYRNKKIDKRLFERLRQLIALRNSIIHGADPVVSEDAVEESAALRRDLDAALGRLE